MSSIRPPSRPDDHRQEIARLRSNEAYLRMREVILREYRRANNEWRTARADQIPALQARATALLEVLELPNLQYKQAGGEGTVFEPIVKPYDREGE
jgi:hypothetical protein